MQNEKNKSNLLTIGNKAFTEKKYEEAYKAYQQALLQMPGLEKIIRFNIEFLEKKGFSYKRKFEKSIEEKESKKKNTISKIENEIHKASERLNIELAIIILSLNGKDLLDRLLMSIELNKPEITFAIYITDHASTDGTRDVLNKWQTKLPININYATENFSFSYSNNRWAEKLPGCKYFLFLNNDIVFESNVIDQMLSAFKDNSVGIIGCDQLEPNNDSDKIKWHHRGISFRYDNQYDFWRPFNLQEEISGHKLGKFRKQMAVTGSVLLIKREDFFAVGGFDEGYEYGYEDVDLCLSVRHKLKKEILCLSTFDVIHADGVTRKKNQPEKLKQQRLKNIKLIKEKYSTIISRLYRQSLLDNELTTMVATKVVFAVSEVGENATAGDFMTAKELGTALEEEFSWCIEYRPRGEKWYDLAGIDIVVAMVDAYNPRNIHSNHPSLIKVAWARNWFDRWCEREWHDEYDIYLTSSKISSSYIHNRLGQPPKLLRIATNPDKFKIPNKDNERKQDFVFTGSYWNAEREIVKAISCLPKSLSGSVYGKNWDKVPEFAELDRGFLPYEKLSEVYAGSKVVIDDANHVTKPWGSVNSRVFDALSAGCLVITNSKTASDDAFGGDLPVYESQEQLAELIKLYTSNEDERRDAVNRLRLRVLAEHTYTHRAYEFKQHLTEFVRSGIRFAIKIPVPDREQAPRWGDYHFSVSLARELREYGHRVRIDFLQDWGRGLLEGDEVSLVLRGLSEYKPRPEHLNYMWLISHPDKVKIDEMNFYDRVFVASEKYSDALEHLVKVPVKTLLQCTDHTKFNLLARLNNNKLLSDIVFVGNTRGQFRKIIKDAISVGISPQIYGAGWEKFVSKDLILAENIANNDLPNIYANANVVLNDHWDDMAKNGFLSNRLFDAVACGAKVISDQCNGIENHFEKSVIMYENPSDIINIISQDSEIDTLQAYYKISAKMVSLETFKARVKTMLSFLEVDLQHKF